jgi:hypothetical protein
MRVKEMALMQLLLQELSEMCPSVPHRFMDCALCLGKSFIMVSGVQMHWATSLLDWFIGLLITFHHFSSLFITSHRWLQLRVTQASHHSTWPRQF